MKQDGILNVYKPKGISSFKCVSEVRKKTGVKKAGHAGTLDPNAEGVLPVLLGKATRLNEFFLNFDKGYRCEILFGKETDSCDIWGEIVNECEVNENTTKNLKNVLSQFEGEQLQVPPIYSAIKKDGVPMYKLARKGENPEMEPRKVNIYSIDLLSNSNLNAVFDVTCSKGTYIRSLCRDIGRKIGTYACMSALIRTHYGPFIYKEAIRLEDIDSNYEDYLYPIDSILTDYAKIELNDRQKIDYLNGKKVILDGYIESNCVRLYYEGLMLALAKVESYDNQTVLVPWKYFGE